MHADLRAARDVTIILVTYSSSHLGQRTHSATRAIQALVAAGGWATKDPQRDVCPPPRRGRARDDPLGSPDSVIEDVTFDDVRMRVRRGSNSDTWGGNVDMRLTRDPELSLFKRDLPALLAHHTERLAVRNLTVEWAEDVPAFFTHAIEAESFRELVVDGFRGRQAQKAGSAIRLVGGEDAVVRDSRAAAGTDVTGRTVFTGSDVRAARQPVVPASFARPGGPGPGRGRGAQNR